MHLIDRVRKDAERMLRGGAYLLPHANRYDGNHVLKDKADLSCHFLNFPYFALKKPPLKPTQIHKIKPSNKDATNQKLHPMRTLLQSRYRSNVSILRDKSQALRKLERKNLRSCVAPEPDDADLSSTKLIDEVIYVPQLWALISGTGTLLRRAVVPMSLRANEMHRDAWWRIDH